jgi:ACR3 family arsenite efflux pump ArsB
MWKILQTISKNLVLAIPTVMILGFVSGLLGDAAWLKSLIVPFTFLMVYPMMVTLKINQVFSGGDLKAQIATQLVNFAIVPFLAFGVAWIFFRDQPYMMLGIVLAGLVPTSGMTISWTGFAGGNVAAAVKMTVIGLTLGSLATPFYVRSLLGASIEMDVSAVFSQIAPIIYGVNFTLSTILGRLILPRGDAIALVYGTVMRNLSIALAVAINAFGSQGSDAALVVAMAYIIQVQSAAWYVKLTDRLFGSALNLSTPQTASRS